MSGKYPIKNLTNIGLDTNILVENDPITNYIKQDCNIENIGYNLTMVSLLLIIIELILTNTKIS